MADQIALEGMKVPPGNVHSRRVFRRIQYPELNAKFLRMRGLNSGLAAREKEHFHAGMPEGLDHSFTVARSASRVKAIAR